MSIFTDALQRRNSGRPPVWFMRQAGRYHSHYQALRKTNSFVDLCKKPELACEATMGPIRDFDFDAAILFSDLLFPLEAMGMGLRYEEGPKLDWHLKELTDLNRLKGGESGASELSFQAEALKLIRRELPLDKGLLGFVGGPLTLFCYAVEGSHSGELNSAREGLTDGRFNGFCENLLDLLAENMALQARAGADTIAILDTCVGEFDLAAFQGSVMPALKMLLEKFHARCPDFPVIYYSKGTGPKYWDLLRGFEFLGLGIDWKNDVTSVLVRYEDQFAIQGNVDPQWLFLHPDELERRLRLVFENVRGLPPQFRRGWICGLGHGVLPNTPESNVRLFLKLQREIFSP